MDPRKINRAARRVAALAYDERDYRDSGRGHARKAAARYKVLVRRAERRLSKAIRACAVGWGE